MANLFQFVPATTEGQASLTVDTSQRSRSYVNPKLWGKFCEHLGANIYHGMEAQILFNCTFEKWRFSAGDNHPNGGVREESDRDKITQQIELFAKRYGLPDSQFLTESYFGGSAFGWYHVGNPSLVRLSPDVGPHGGRAQRIEVLDSTKPGCGIGQWTFLPLHRTKVYFYRIVARSEQPCTLEMRLSPVNTPDVVARTQIELGPEWETLTGEMQLSEDALADALYQFAITSNDSANIVIDRVLLYPSDHIHGADPDVIQMLKDVQLPLLRWPGGNFVSGYHWRDGVGPIDTRPTLPNPAWGGLEFNLFGTDEFMAFCDAVGCEPMICVNAGNGSAEEAAAWVEYCNGSVDTPMGELRAVNGHPDPYDIKYWEIGNELYGHWQVNWTTPAGNADRYRRFRAAMLAVDSSLQLIGCGHGNEPDSVWNRTLIEKAGGDLRCITDHILTGGDVDAYTDPVELYHAFMGYPIVLEQRYRDLRERMHAATNPEPHMAITELQLFAHFKGDVKPDGSFMPELLPRPDTIAEALSLSMIINTCIRLGDFVELLTHSATVNHGGGLRKVHERVYANPVHYAHQLGIAMAGGQPVATQLTSEVFSTERAFAHIPPLTDIPILDTLAVITEDGDLVMLIIHRGGSSGPVDLTIKLIDFEAQLRAEMVTLAGDVWYSRNTLEEPEKVIPVYAPVDVEDGQLFSINLSPFSLTRITIKSAK